MAQLVFGMGMSHSTMVTLDDSLRCPLHQQSSAMDKCASFPVQDNDQG